MVVNENAGWQVPRGVLRFIASRLAPTDGIGRRRKHKPGRQRKRGLAGAPRCFPVYREQARSYRSTHLTTAHRWTTLRYVHSTRNLWS